MAPKFELFHCYGVESDVTRSENCLSAHCGGCGGGGATDGRHLKHSERRHRARRCYPSNYPPLPRPTYFAGCRPANQPIGPLALPTCPPATKNIRPIDFQEALCDAISLQDGQIVRFFFFANAKTNRVPALSPLDRILDATEPADRNTGISNNQLKELRL